MYLDKPAGHITPEFFDKPSATWRPEQGGLLRNIQESRRPRRLALCKLNFGLFGMEVTLD
jgi:hypothetical protein